MQPKNWGFDSTETITNMQDLIKDVYDLSNALGLDVIPTPEELQA
jgi:hypothetical protein